MYINPTPREPAQAGEWETDKYGRRFRRIGKSIEYETIVTIGGVPVPESQVEAFNARRKAEQEKRLAEERRRYEEEQAKPKLFCPFNTSGTGSLCKRENCPLFVQDKCALAVMADEHGTQQTDQAQPTQQRKCPFNIYVRCESCALYNNGCAFTRLAAATYKITNTRKETK